VNDIKDEEQYWEEQERAEAEDRLEDLEISSLNQQAE
jgi:hypothetical protein